MHRPAAYLDEIRPTLALAAPMIVGQVSQMLMGLTDSLMIGRAGTVPLAASSFGNSGFSVFYVFGIGLMIPVSIFVARARGAQQPAEAGEYLRHGLGLAVAVGLGEMLLMGAMATQLHRFGQPPEVLAIVTPYFLFSAASLVPVLAFLVLRQFAEAMGHPWAPMFIILTGVILNVLLNWIFIFGNLGAPALGLTGAGLATWLARVFGLVAIFLWLRRDARVREAWPVRARRSEATERSAAVAPRGSGGWFAPWSRERLREMLQVGLPASFMLLFEVTAFSFSGVMIGWLGSVPLAAHQIAITCASLAFMFPLGLSLAAGVRVSHAVGSGERDRLRPVAFGAVGLGLLVMGLCATVFAFGGRWLASCFVVDPAVITLAAQLLLVAALFQLADGVQVIAASVLRGIMDVKVPVLITLVAYWVIALPLGFGLGFGAAWGAVGVWTGIAGGLAFAAVFLARRYARLTR